MEANETQQLLLQHVRQLDAEVAELKKESPGPLTESLAHWLAAQFVVTAQAAAVKTEAGCLELKTLCALNANVVALRHGDHCAERLKLERERLELDVKKFHFDAARSATIHARAIKLICSDKSLSEKQMIEKVCLRLFGAPPEDMEEVYYGKRLTPEQRAERIRQIFRVAPQPQNAPPIQLHPT
jgi:hypothetical protein